MTQKDWYALIAIIFGIISAILNYVIYDSGRTDFYNRYGNCAKRWLICAEWSFRVQLVAAVCWAVCVVKDIA